MMSELDVNAATFADTAQISRSVLSNVLNQKSNVTIETLNKILTAYPEWSKLWLLFGEGTPRVGKNEGKDTIHPNTSSGDSINPKQEYYSASLFPNSLVASSTIEEKLICNDSTSPDQRRTIKPQMDGTYLNVVESAHPHFTLSQSRKIQEIRIFYDDGSFETYTLKQ